MVHHCHGQCLKLIHKQPNDEFMGLDIGLKQGIILKILLTEDGIAQKELTRRLQITSSSSGQLIEKLEHGKYVERRINPNDRRAFNVYATESGCALGERYKEKSSTMLEEWSSNLTCQEKEQLYILLAKFSEGLEKQINKE